MNYPPVSSNAAGQYSELNGGSLSIALIPRESIRHELGGRNTNSGMKLTVREQNDASRNGIVHGNETNQSTGNFRNLNGGTAGTIFLAKNILWGYSLKFSPYKRYLQFRYLKWSRDF